MLVSGFFGGRRYSSYLSQFTALDENLETSCILFPIALCHFVSFAARSLFSSSLFGVPSFNSYESKRTITIEGGRGFTLHFTPPGRARELVCLSIAIGGGIVAQNDEEGYLLLTGLVAV